MEAGTVGRAATPVRPQTTGVRRLVTETKASIKTSEWWLTVAVIVGILSPPQSSRAATPAGPMSSSPVRHGST